MPSNLSNGSQHFILVHRADDSPSADDAGYLKVSNVFDGQSLFEARLLEFTEQNLSSKSACFSTGIEYGSRMAEN